MISTTSSTTWTVPSSARATVQLHCIFDYLDCTSVCFHLISGCSNYTSDYYSLNFDCTTIFDYFDCSRTASTLSLTTTTTSPTASVAPLSSMTTTSTILHLWLLQLHLRLPQLHFCLLRLSPGLLLLYLRLVQLLFWHYDYISNCLSDTSDYYDYIFDHFDYIYHYFSILMVFQMTEL
jgi:hypothetical protein